MKFLRAKSNVFLLLTALIWGATFVAQKSAMDVIGPFAFNGVRCLLGSASLFFISLFFKTKKYKTRDLLEGGAVAGLLLFVAANLQQFGIVNSTAGHAGFVSSLYIVMVPLFALISGKRVEKCVWFGVLLAVFGLYFLSVKGGFSLQNGDFIILCSAVFFALHIMWIDKYSKRADAIKLSCLQFLLAGIFSTCLSVAFETTPKGAIPACAGEIFVSGVLSCAVAFTLQISAQKYVRPYIASLILSLESVFAVGAGYIFLHEILSAREIFGCVLMFAAVFAAHCGKKHPKLLQNAEL